MALGQEKAAGDEQLTAAGTTQKRERGISLRGWILRIGLALIIVGAIPAWQRAWHAYYLFAARRHITQKEFDRALTMLEQADRMRPHQAEVAYLLAVANRRSGRVDKVEANLNSALARGWPKRDVLRQSYLLQAQVGRFSEVEGSLKELFAQDLDDDAALEVYEALAHGYWNNHQLKDAIECLDYWIAWRPHDLEPRLMRAEGYTQLSDTAAAEKEYREILKFAPDCYSARALLGHLLLEHSAVEEAAAEFHYCWENSHRTVAVLAGLAECEQRSGRPDRAAQWLDQIDEDELDPENLAKVVLLRADIARFRRDHQTAVRLLEEVLRVWPHDPAVHESLGQSYAALGDRDAANRHLELSREISARAHRFFNLQQAAARLPNDPNVRCEIAHLLTEQGFDDDAVGWWISALRCDPDHPPSHAALAAYYAKNGDRAAAEKHRRAGEAAADAAFAKAWSALQSGDRETARRIVPTLANHKSFARRANLLTASLLCKEGQYEKAAAAVEQELNDPALRPWALIVVGESLVARKALLAAEPLFQEVLTTNPRSLDAHRWLSVLYYDLGAIDHADFHLKQVAELDPTDYRASRLLGLINKDFEVYDVAVEHYRESLRRNPRQPPREEVLLEMAECQLHLRDYAGAWETLQTAAPSLEALALRAECLFNQGDRQAALQMADEVLKRTPNQLRALLICGDAALVDRDAAKAVEYYGKACEHHPFDYTARHKFSQALAHLGDQVRAQREMAKAEELKSLRQRFARLHEEAFASPHDAAPRRELAQIAQQLGRDDLAQVWREAAQAIESGETSPAQPPSTD